MTKWMRKHLEEAANMLTNVSGTYNGDRPILKVHILSQLSNTTNLCSSSFHQDLVPFSPTSLYSEF